MFVPSIRSTYASDHEKCPRFGMWRHRYGLTQPTESFALNLGSIYHAGVAAHYINPAGGQETVENAGRKVLTAIIERMGDAVGNDGRLPSGVPIQSAMEKANEAHAKGMALALWVLRRYPLDQGTFVPVAIEKLYTIGSTAAGIQSVPITGRIDMLLRNKRTGALALVDHKTTPPSERPSDRASTLPFETQPRLYRLLVEKFLDTQPSYKGKLKSCFHTLIRKPTIRQTQKETFQQYLDRLSARYDDDDKKAQLEGEPPSYMISDIPFSGPALDYDLASRIRNMQHAASCEPSPHLFPTHDSACFKYNRPCMFLPLCRAGAQGRADQWPELIQLKYKVSPRDAEDLAEHEGGDE